MFATPAAAAAGLKQEPTGFVARRFQTAALLKPGDRMIPLLTGKKPKDGKEAVAACVYAFDSDFKGRIAVSGLMGRGPVGSNSEERQGLLLARAVGISFAERIENFFWYEYRAPERDPFYSEHHFGIVHDNFAPKPAWGTTSRRSRPGAPTRTSFSSVPSDRSSCRARGATTRARRTSRSGRVPTDVPPGCSGRSGATRCATSRSMAGRWSSTTCGASGSSPSRPARRPGASPRANPPFISQEQKSNYEASRNDYGDGHAVHER